MKINENEVLNVVERQFKYGNIREINMMLQCMPELSKLYATEARRIYDLYNEADKALSKLRTQLIYSFENPESIPNTEKSQLIDHIKTLRKLYQEGGNKIELIKKYREISNTPLRESKDFIEENFDKIATWQTT